MGRFKNFFKKIGSGFKKAGRWLWGKTKSAAKWVADKGLKIGKVVTSVAQHMPGVIGKVAGYANKGIAAAQAAIDAVPKGKVKDKLQQGLNKAEEAKAKAEQVANNVAGVANKVANATNAAIDTSKNIVANVKKVI